MTLTGTGWKGVDLADEAKNPDAARLTGQDADLFFEQSARTHYPRLVKLAHRLLAWSAGRQEVEDVVQEVFLSAWMHRAKFRGESNIGAWLTRITINQCRSRQRKRRVRLGWLRFQRDLLQQTPPVVETPDPVGADETSAQVRHAIASLPQKHREVVVLHYLQQTRIEEIAQLLGETKNAVEVRLYRARQRLKSKLADLMEH